MESTLNKVNAFLSDDRIREIFSFQKSSFSLREIIDNKKILLIKLDQGRLKENADLIGSLLMTKIRMAAFSRSDIPKEERVPFYLYIDECFYAKHNIEGGILPLQTAEVSPAYEEFGIEKGKWEETFRTTPFGKKYLRERKPKEIEKEAVEKPAIRRGEDQNIRRDSCHDDPF